MRSTHTVVLLTASSLLLGATPAFAAGRLTSARAVSASGSAEQPQVAVGAAGRTLAVWNRQGKKFDLPKGSIEARLGRIGGTWGPIETLATSGSAPVAAVGADSVAAVAWATEGAKRVTTIYVSIAKAGHNFGAKRVVASGVGVGAPLGAPSGVEVQPDGRVVVIWTRAIKTPPQAGSEASVDYTLVAPGGGQARGQLGTSTPLPASVAQTTGGTVLVASRGVPTFGSSPVNGQAEVATLAPGARGFSGEQTIYAVAGNDYAEADGIGAFAGAGGAGVALSAEEIQPNALELAPLLPSGSFGPAFPAVGIDIQSGLVGYAGPVAALPGDGAQVAAYRLEQLNNPTAEAIVSAQVMAAVRPDGAAVFAAPTQLSSGAGIPSAPVTASAGGSTVVLWGQSSGCRQRVYAAIRPAGGGFAAAAAVAAPFTTQHFLCGYANNTQLSISGSGTRLIAGWLEGSKLDVATLTAQ
jgi:hypothetical protein